MPKHRKQKKRKRKRKPEVPEVDVVDITVEDLDHLIRRLEQKALQDEDYDLLLNVLRSYDYVITLLNDDHLKLNRLKRVLFGSTKSFSKVVPIAANDEAQSEDDGAQPSDEPAESENSENGTKGHGRRSADE